MAEVRCYMIVIAELTDRERFLAGYARVVPPLVVEFGGRYVVRGSSGTFVEGGFGEHPERARFRVAQPGASAALLELQRVRRREKAS